MSFSKRPLAEDGIGWCAHEVWEDGAGQRDSGLLLLLPPLVLGPFLGALALLLVLVLAVVLVVVLAAVVLRLPILRSGSLAIALQLRLVLSPHKHLAQLGERHVLLVTVFVPGQVPPKARVSCQTRFPMTSSVKSS